MGKNKNSAGWRSRASALACLLAIVLLAGASAAAAPMVVDPHATACVTPSVHYTTIQQAINASQAGGTVQVCPGVYPEQISITQPLTLKGVGANGGVSRIVLPASLVTYNTTVWPISAQVLVTTPNAKNVTLQNLVIDGSNSSTDCTAPYIGGIVFDSGTGGVVRGVSIQNQFVHGVNGYDCGSGIGIFAGDNSAVTIQSVEISNVDLLGVYEHKASVDVQTSTISARNPMYRNKNNEGIYFDGGTGGSATGNQVFDWSWGITLWYPTVAIAVSNNQVVNCSANGIYCVACNGQTISGNKLYRLGDQATGINFYLGTGGNSIQNNLITQARWGIYLNFSTGIDTISSNTLQDLTFGVIAYAADLQSSNKYYNDAVNLMLQ